jgi:hypothetical protein
VGVGWADSLAPASAMLSVAVAVAVAAVVLCSWKQGVYDLAWRPGACRSVALSQVAGAAWPPRARNIQEPYISRTHCLRPACVH